MFKSRSLVALAATSMVMFGGVAATTSAPAEAGWRHGNRYAPAYRYAGPRGYHYNRYRGGNAALGIAAGVLAVGALAAAAAPAYAAPGYGQPAYHEPAYGYQPAYAQPSYGYAQPVYYAPRCHIQHRNVWDPYYGYVSQPVRVCR